MIVLYNDNIIIIMKGLRYSGYIYVFDEDDDDVAGFVLK